eukprot:13398157-Alexandrium_andersonii.AAC.1
MGLAGQVCARRRSLAMNMFVPNTKAMLKLSHAGLGMEVLPRMRTRLDDAPRGCCWVTAQSMRADGAVPFGAYLALVLLCFGGCAPKRSSPGG